MLWYTNMAKAWVLYWYIWWRYRIQSGSSHHSDWETDWEKQNFRPVAAYNITGLRLDDKQWCHCHVQTNRFLFSCAFVKSKWVGLNGGHKSAIALIFACDSCIGNYHSMSIRQLLTDDLSRAHTCHTSANGIQAQTCAALISAILRNVVQLWYVSVISIDMSLLYHTAEISGVSTNIVL